MSAADGKCPSARFEKTSRPSTRTSNWFGSPGLIVASTSSRSFSSAARLAARRS
jgi:hypothetical protein